MRSEWDETKQHDVLFLLTVQPPDQVALAAIRDRGEEPSPAQQHGLIYVRGAEVTEVRRGAHDPAQELAGCAAVSCKLQHLRESLARECWSLAAGEG